MGICAASILAVSRPDPHSPLQVAPPVPLTGQALSLVEQLRRTFRRRGDRAFGEFDTESREFEGIVQDYLAERSTWATLTDHFGKRFAQACEKDDTPVAGQWLMVHWNNLDAESLDFFWMPFSEALTVHADGHVAPVTFLQTDKLPLAIRIDISPFGLEHPERQICLVKSPGTQALKTALLATLGVAFTCDTKEETIALLDTVDAFVQEVPEEQRTPARDHIVNYCVEKDKQGYPVEIQELSEQLASISPVAFADYLNQRQPELPERVYTHRGSLKRYLRFWGRDNDLSISFSTRRFGNGVYYDAARGVLEIASLPRTLKQQLHEHLHDRGKLPDDNAGDVKPLTDDQGTSDKTP